MATKGTSWYGDSALWLTVKESSRQPIPLDSTSLRGPSKVGLLIKQPPVTGFSLPYSFSRGEKQGLLGRSVLKKPPFKRESLPVYDGHACSQDALGDCFFEQFYLLALHITKLLDNRHFPIPLKMFLKQCSKLHSFTKFLTTWPNPYHQQLTQRT